MLGKDGLHGRIGVLVGFDRNMDRIWCEGGQRRAGHGSGKAPPAATVSKCRRVGSTREFWDIGVCGWRAIHAVSLGHENASLWLGLEPGRKLLLPLGLLLRYRK